MTLTLTPRVERPASSFQQWLAMSGRIIKQMTFGGEILGAVLVSFVCTVGFYLPMKYVMETVNKVDYGQYVVAIIVLQSLSISMASAAQRAAVEGAFNFTDRLKTMPIRPTVILIARLTGSLYRSAVSIAVIMVLGYIIGFRLHAGPVQSVLFFVFSLSVGVILSLVADFMGTVSANATAMSQAITLPSLILGMMSTGFVPEAGFPEWTHPFVRNQPVSQISGVMREMSTTGATWHSATAALIWLSALAAIATPLAVWAIGRRR